MVVRVTSAVALYPTHGRWQYSLRSAMLFVLWIATSLSLTRAVDFLGIVFALVTAPAVIRTGKFVANSNASGRAVELAAILATFFSSLAIIAMTAAISLAVVLGAALVASLLGLVALTSLCRYLIPGLAGPHALVRFVLRRVASHTARLAAVTRGLVRRVRQSILCSPGLIASSLGVLIGACCTASLAAILFVVSGARLLIDRIARQAAPSRWLLRQAIFETARLAAVDRQLLRRFRSP